MIHWTFKSIIRFLISSSLRINSDVRKINSRRLQRLFFLIRYCFDHKSQITKSDGSIEVRTSLISLLRIAIMFRLQFKISSAAVFTSTWIKDSGDRAQVSCSQSLERKNLKCSIQLLHLLKIDFISSVTGLKLKWVPQFFFFFSCRVCEWICDWNIFHKNLEPFETSHPISIETRSILLPSNDSMSSTTKRKFKVRKSH